MNDAFQRLARATIEQAERELTGELVATRQDAARCEARGFRLLAGELRGRAQRLERLTDTLTDLLGNSATP